MTYGRVCRLALSAGMARMFPDFRRPVESLLHPINVGEQDRDQRLGHTHGLHAPNSHHGKEDLRQQGTDHHGANRTTNQEGIGCIWHSARAACVWPGGLGLEH